MITRNEIIGQKSDKTCPNCGEQLEYFVYAEYSVYVPYKCYDCDEDYSLEDLENKEQEND